MGAILLYHRIGTTATDPWALNVSARHFREHLAVLRARFQPQRLRDLAGDASRGKVDDDRIVVTFDDGYADNVHTALPLLEEADVPATFFIPTGALGANSEFWWDELDALLLQPGTLPSQLDVVLDGIPRRWTFAPAYTDHECARDASWLAWHQAPTARHDCYYQVWLHAQSMDESDRLDLLRQIRDWAGGGRPVRPTHRTMTRHELVRLAESPLVEIGGHTVTHPRLAALSPADQRAQIVDSKRELQQLTGQTVRALSYPYGKHSDYTAETVELVREAGYECACTNTPQGESHDLLRLPRLFVNDLPGDEFAAWLSASVA